MRTTDVAARRAMTDRNLMQIQAMRRDPPDPAMAHTDQEIAAPMAALLAEEFAGDEEVVGRALVVASSILTSVQATLTAGPILLPENLGRVMINTVALMGERLAHGEAG